MQKTGRSFIMYPLGFMQFPRFGPHNMAAAQQQTTTSAVRESLALAWVVMIFQFRDCNLENRPPRHKPSAREIGGAS